MDRQSISWVRTRDAHILSVDGAVFVSDPRILIVTSPERAEWTLIIKAFGGQTQKPLDINKEGKIEIV